MSSNGNHSGGGVGNAGAISSPAVNGAGGGKLSVGGSTPVNGHGTCFQIIESLKFFNLKINFCLVFSLASVVGGSGNGVNHHHHQHHHHPEGRKPKLRRFNSHDTSTNMFSVADFENARLARRNEIEMKQRLQHRMKINSLSSCGSSGGLGIGSGGGGCGDFSTGDSKGSKYSNDVSEEMFFS